MSCESEAPDEPGFDLLGAYYEETGQSAEAFRRLFPFSCRWLKWFKSFNFTLFIQESLESTLWMTPYPFIKVYCLWCCNTQRLSPLSKMSLSVPFPSSFLSPLPPSDILLTHNCGSPPPIAGNHPFLRPPRHTVCFPTMHLSSKTFPYTFGLLIVPLFLHPSNVPFNSPVAFHRPVLTPVWNIVNVAVQGAKLTCLTKNTNSI